MRDVLIGLLVIAALFGFLSPNAWRNMRAERRRRREIDGR